MWAVKKILATSNDMRMLGRERENNCVLITPLHLGALTSINEILLITPLMNFALICKDRMAIPLSFCKIKEFPRLES